MFPDIYNDPRITLFINSLPGAFLIYKLNADASDSLLFLSDNAENLWGVSKKEALDNVQKLWEPIHHEDLATMVTSIQESAQNLSFWNHTWRIMHPDGKTKWLNGRAQPIKNENDDSIIWQTIIIDVTTLKEQENNVLALSKKLEEYSKKHSHELRTPLTQLMGLVDLIKEEVDHSNTKEIFYIDQLLNATTKLDAVVREIAYDLDIDLNK